MYGILCHMDEGYPRPSLKGWWTALRSEQRTAVVVLLLCTVSAAGLSISQLGQQLHAPFFISKNKADLTQKFFADQAQQDNKVELLKQKDTDHDGLSDYDELYVYHTSPYLADSDSDGIPDAIEVAQGTDPNCPQGKTCFQAPNDVGLASASSGASFQEFLQVTPVTNGPQKFLERPPDPATLTPAQIRDYLLTKGLVAKEELALLPDAAVVEVYTTAYQDALRIQATSGPVPPPASGGTGSAHTATTPSLHLGPIPVLDESGQ